MKIFNFFLGGGYQRSDFMIKFIGHLFLAPTVPAVKNKTISIHSLFGNMLSINLNGTRQMVDQTHSNTVIKPHTPRRTDEFQIDTHTTQ